MTRRIGMNDLFGEIFGKNMILDDEVEVDDENKRIYLDAVSNSTSAECPFCHQVSTRRHALFTRTIRCGNFEGKGIIVRVVANRYKCGTANCVRTFREQLEFAQPYRQFSDEVRMRALSNAINMSYSQVQRTFKLQGEQLCRCTAQRLVEEIHYEHIPIKFGGLDDVSSHKNNDYRTVVYDLCSRRLVKMFDGRDGTGVEKYMRTQSGCLFLNRDRSTAFASGAYRALPECKQISDKFHLIDNDIDELNQYLRANVPEAIYIDENLTVLDYRPETIKVLKEPNWEYLRTLDYDNSPVLCDDGSLYPFDFRLRNKNRRVYVEREHRRLEKQKLAISIRQYSAGEGEYSFPRETKYAAIARIFSTTPHYVKTYLAMTDDEVRSMSEIKEYSRDFKLPPYMNIIAKMLLDNIRPCDIFYYIKYVVGTDVVDSTLASHINYVISNNFKNKRGFNMRSLLIDKLPDGITYISRGRLSRFLFTKDPKKLKSDETLTKVIDVVKERYPVVREISEMYDDFYEIFQGTDPSKVDKFIEKYKNTCLSSFCNGLLNDIDAVKNAVIYNFIKTPEGEMVRRALTSGFVEGLNLLYKLILRQAYGRLRTEGIEKKLSLATAQRCSGFSLRELVTGDRILRADIGRYDHPVSLEEYVAV